MNEIKKREHFLPLATPDISQKEMDLVCEVLRSGWLTTGPKVKEFEEKLAAYVGCRDAVGLNSCTGGLHSALSALGIGPGDEVIVPSLTFAASAHVIHWVGARPVLAEVCKEDCTIDISSIEKLYSEKTKALLPVHFGGYSCDMDAINSFARQKGLAVIEDAAHLIGGTYRSGEPVGNSDNAVAFSFYATKNMTTGEGGAVVSNNEDLLAQIRRKSYFGVDKDAFNRYSDKGSWYYEIVENGFKYNMDSIHAALGIVQLERLNSFNQRRRHLVGIYKERLNTIFSIETPAIDPPDSIWHLFVIRVKEGAPLGRDALSLALREYHVGSSVHFIPLHLQPFYGQTFGYKKGDFPVTEDYYNECLSLPLCPSMEDEDVHYVCHVLEHLLS